MKEFNTYRKEEEIYIIIHKDFMNGLFKIVFALLTIISFFLYKYF